MADELGLGRDFLQGGYEEAGSAHCRKELKIRKKMPSIGGKKPGTAGALPRIEFAA
jgi:hypothetical protein